MTVRELQKIHLPSLSPEDFFVLVGEALQKTKSFLFAHPEYTLSREEEKRVNSYLKRRLEREPVAYITGHKEFYGREFQVSRDTLIPRPETEIMIEEINRHASSLSLGSSLDIVDVGTGSGNIIITLSQEIKREKTRFIGIDISPVTLQMAKKNSKTYHAETSVTFLQSDLLSKYRTFSHEIDHLVIAANLPYLSEKIYAATEKDVREYEPKNALLSRQEGLEHYHRTLDQIKNLDRPVSTTTIFFEISPEQSLPLSSCIEQLFPHCRPRVVPDLSGRNRLIIATL